jgi:DNA-binding MarR family transcriptional regulator
MTSTLDVLEDRGWLRRTPYPDDRRSVFIEITNSGRTAADQVLPGIRNIERSVLSVLAEPERRTLLDMLARVLAHRS